MTGRPQSADRRTDAVSRFIEQLGLLFADSGMPRMAARTFAYMVVGDRHYTATDLATGLRVSGGAVSGAVRYLVQAGLVVREREPGASADSYRVHDDAWSVFARHTEEYIRRAEDLLTYGIELLDEGTPGWQRVHEVLEYQRFWREELPRVMERWQERRASARDR